MKFLRNTFILAVAATVALFSVACSKGGDNALSSAQQDQVNQMIPAYLLAHPEILIQVSQKLQAKMQADQAQKAIGGIKQNDTAFSTATTSPVVGDKNGPVTLVEFFDYQCIHCSEMFPIVKKVIAANPNLRVVFKEFPIFGAASQYAAAAALAAEKQGKYLEMHNALFASGLIEGKMTKPDVDAIAKKVGLNMVELKKDMQSEEVKKELQANFTLAQAIGIQGTPGFIILPTTLGAGSDSKITFIPGGTNEQTLEAGIAKAK